MNVATTADYCAQVFQEVGIDRVFMYPGGTIAPLINACRLKGIGIEVFKNEQGAGYAALAWARITGKPQVVMVTSGPGVTNLITPLADAFYDSIPLIALTGQIGTADLENRKAVRQRGFQEVPTVALTQHISKRSSCMMCIEDVLREVPLAFELAESGRPGPVVIDFPMNIQRAELNKLETYDHRLPSGRVENNEIKPQVLLEITAVAMTSKRPVLLLGQGALAARLFDQYIEIAKLLDAFVVTSFLGTGSYDTSDERWLGYIGHTGHLAANCAVFESDFLLVLGSRLDVRQTGTVIDKFVPQGKVCWVESDPAEIDNPRVAVNWAIRSDISTFCNALLRNKNIRRCPVDISWFESMISIKEQKIEDSPDLNSTQIQPRSFLLELSRLINKSLCTVVTGVGCHQHWAARHLPFHPQRCRLLTSGGHGTMGFDLPTAIGAAMAEPNRLVICIVGDGSFLMNIQEMAALSERMLNVKILVMNNQRLGIVSQFQLITWSDDPTTGKFSVPDFCLISEGFGVPAQTLVQLGDVAQKLQWLMSQHGPALLDVQIDSKADVVPMLLAGQTMGEMWMGRSIQ